MKILTARHVTCMDGRVQERRAWTHRRRQLGGVLKSQPHHLILSDPLCQPVVAKSAVIRLADAGMMPKTTLCTQTHPPSTILLSVFSFDCACLASFAEPCPKRAMYSCRSHAWCHTPSADGIVEHQWHAVCLMRARHMDFIMGVGWSISLQRGTPSCVRFDPVPIGTASSVPARGQRASGRTCRSFLHHTAQSPPPVVATENTCTCMQDSKGMQAGSGPENTMMTPE